MATRLKNGQLIVGLMALVLALVLGMAWQAHRATRAHNETAVSVLKDYARLAADEYSRRAMAAAGYYGYYTLINQLRTAPSETINDAVRPESAAQYVFSLDLIARQVSSSEELTSRIRTHILEHLAPLVQGELPDSGYVIEHAGIDDKQRIFVVSWTDDRRRLFGFEVNGAWLVRTLEQTFSDNVLLPESLAGGAVTNDLLYLQMRDSTGESLFKTGTPVDDSTRVTKTLLDEYGGVFRGHTITAGIDPALAESLIIGGLPKSRLPVIVVLVFLAVGLLIAAIWQLKRENAVMQMRSNFVAEVSHELRTPLTQIRMFTESLLFERMRSGEDKQRALSIINRESRRLIQMVENILRFSDLERSRGQLSMQAHDLGTIIASVVDEFQVIAEGTGAHIETVLQCDVTAAIDTDAMRQVLLNLLDNAVKYGPQGQTVNVTLQRAGDTASISVDDEGPGVPESEREHIWGGYYRLERERGAAIAGTGIGLAVVGEIVSRHGGTVRAEDSSGGGARFVVELPL